jgi:hypothetical protein
MKEDEDWNQIKTAFFSALILGSILGAIIATLIFIL